MERSVRWLAWKLGDAVLVAALRAAMGLWVGGFMFSLVSAVNGMLQGPPPWWVFAALGAAGAFSVVIALTGVIAFVQFWSSQIEILHEVEGLPFRQEWDDDGGHQVLFRVQVRNRSQLKSLTGCSVRLTTLAPRAVQGIPFPLRLSNEEESVHDFALAPGDSREVDVFQQSSPSGRLLLWNAVRWLDKDVPTQGYEFEITVYASNVRPCRKRGRVILENNTALFRLVD